jgi:hypothetical protein
MLSFLFLVLLSSPAVHAKDCPGTIANDAILGCTSADNVTLNAAFLHSDVPDLASVRGTLMLFGVSLNALTFSNLSEVRYVSISGGSLSNLFFPNVSRCDSVQLTSRSHPINVHMPFVSAMLSLSTRDNSHVVMPQLAMLDLLTINGENSSIELPALTFIQRDVRIALLAGDPIDLPSVRSIGAAFRLFAGNVSMPALDSVGHDLVVDSGRDVNWTATLFAPNLTSVGGTFLSSSDVFVQKRLTEVGGNLCLDSEQVQLIDLPVLQRIGSDNLDVLLCSANSSVAFGVFLGNNTALDLPSLRTVRGDIFIAMGENSSIIQPSLHAYSIAIYCYTNAVNTIRLSGSSFRDGLRIECLNDIESLEMLPPMTIGGNITLFLAENLESLEQLAPVLEQNNESLAVDVCTAVVLGVCRDEAYRWADYWQCRGRFIVSHMSCFTCGNSVLNFGELADCGPRLGCLLLEDCPHAKFNAKTCTCISPTVSDNAPGGGFGVTEISLSVAAVALCIIGLVAAYFIRRALRRSRHLAVSFSDLQPQFERI